MKLAELWLLLESKRSLGSWKTARGAHIIVTKGHMGGIASAKEGACELSGLAQINIMEIEKAESIDFHTSY